MRILVASTALLALTLGLTGCVTSGGDSLADPAGGKADEWERSCQVGTPTGPLTVATTRGLVRGDESGHSVRFLGIPFAAPPVGELRFQPPIPAECWADVRDAREYGESCPQAGFIGDDVVGDEDCLTLNVWTPGGLEPTAPPRPVLFFIHGGANVVGGSNMELPLFGNQYDARELAESTGAVVVTTNYRLGALGFLVHPALDAESEHGASGNYGLLDLVAALKWTQDNVANFGGDPERVMVFGESAGAFNTCALVGSPLAAGLFSSALMESGVCAEPDASFRAIQSAPVVDALGCTGASDVAACLREVPVETYAAVSKFDFLSAGSELKVDLAHPSAGFFGPSVDGWVLPLSPLEAMRRGVHNHMPFVIGTNENEFDLFNATTTMFTCHQAETKLRSALPSVADDIIDLYPCSLLSPKDMYSDVMTDVLFTCGTRSAARAIAASQAEPVYRYWWTHHRTFGPTVTLRAYHSQELSFVFGTVGRGADIATSSEQDLSESVQAAWVSLAASGNPSTGSVVWDRYDPGRDNAIVLDDDIDAIAGIRDEQCDFWDSVLGDN